MGARTIVVLVLVLVLASTFFTMIGLDPCMGHTNDGMVRYLTVVLLYNPFLFTSILHKNAYLIATDD